jgi:hypothetical protein
MTLVYESLTENLLRFSKNRLEVNKPSDYSILAQTKYSFKLSFDEKVFDLQWLYNQSLSEVKGAIASNQRVCIVDQNLAIIS